MPDPLGPVSLDGLGLGQAFLGGMVGNSGRRLRRLRRPDTSPRRAGAVPRVVWRRGPNVGLKMTAEAVGEGILQRERTIRHCATVVLDPACFKEDGGPSIAERINRSLLRLARPFHAADNSRVPTGDRWAAGISCVPA